MSKLADRIRKASRLEAQPLGFITSRSQKEATMLLGGVASDASAAADFARNGADFVIIRSAGSAAPPKTEGGGPIFGAELAGDADASALREAGYDFVLFDADKTASTAVLDEGIGYVMKVPAEATDADLRSLEGFGLDALDLGVLEGTLTVRRQMELRKLAALARKPLIAALTDASISVKQLQTLRDTNVIAVTTERAADAAQLRKTIDALPPRARRKDDDRPSPLVPAAVAGGGADEDDDDDDHEHEHDH